MKIIFKKSLAKDLKSISDTKTQAKLAEIISEIKNAESLSEIKNVKKLQGYADAYRIIMGNYRIGIFLNGEEFIISRILKRNDIYKLFP